MRKEALLYQKLDGQQVQCNLCCHRCKIANEKFGFCGVRQNIDAVLFTHVYGNIISYHVDPIEKKPLYHFLPGSKSFSIATIGCNFRCGFCQNWEISQVRVDENIAKEENYHSPETVIKAALDNGCKSIAYTYTEPTIFFEYALDCAQLAKEKGLHNIFVTNGFMTKEAMQMIMPYLNAANIDLKFFKEGSYNKICNGSLQPVLDSIALMNKLGIWVEVTTLVVPGENDSEQELRAIAQFLASVDKNIPWHISRFHPDYKLQNTALTPEKTLKKVFDIGYQAGLRYVYIGNVFAWGNDTICYKCKKLLIKREGFNILDNHLQNNSCSYCKVIIPGVFN
ncbi:MAG: AmmeMemoRadiSam system radical SAM enzyme [Candidatus Omnitrophota bacterium]